MSEAFILDAEVRSDAGKGASRRLRREGKVPAILYGGHRDPQMITLVHKDVAKQLENEAFYSHILTVKVGGASERAILKDIHRHPAKPIIMHMDLQRVSESEKIRVHVPLHFINEATSPGVKAGGLVSHQMVEVEITCLPKDLPEFIEVDLGSLNMNEAIHMGELKLPAGVEFAHAGGEDAPVASIHGKGAEEVEAEGGEEAAGSTGETA